MSVIRTVHNKENPYAQLSKKVINDTNLSLEALGLWTWCMSKPNDWTFHVDHIAKERNVSKKVIYRIIKELISNSYCIRFQQRTQSHGKFGEYEYFFFEYKPEESDIKEILELYPNLNSPELSKIKNSLPCSQNGHAANDVDFSQEKCPHNENEPLSLLPHAANPLSGFGHSTKDISKIEERATSESRNAAAFLEFMKSKQLTDDDIRTIYPTYSEENIREAIAWVESKPNVQKFAAYLTNGLQRLASGEKLQVKLSEAEQSENNRTWAKEMRSKAKVPTGIQFELLNQYVECGNGVHQPSCLYYTEPGFKEKFKEYAKKWGVQI